MPELAEVAYAESLLQASLVGKRIAAVACDSSNCDTNVFKGVPGGYKALEKVIKAFPFVL